MRAIPVSERGGELARPRTMRARKILSSSVDAAPNFGARFDGAADFRKVADR
jgi:hypothetical protein